MKYFTRELWEKLNSELEEESLKAQKKWNENSKKYSEEFNKVKELLPEHFMEIYRSNNDFHDFLLTSLKLVKNKTKIFPFVDLEISIFDGKDNYKIVYSSISKLDIKGNYNNYEIEYLKKKKNTFDSWGYDEFGLINNNVLSHEILFLSGSTIYVQFAKISIS